MLNQVHSWYKNQIPPLNSPEFPAFMGQSMRLVQYIVGRKMLPPLEVRFANSDTAYCVPSQNNIWLPLWPLSQERSAFPLKNFESLSGTDRAAMVLALYNGFIIHESHHLKLTPDADKLFEMAAKGERVETRVLMGIIQIVEDLYIDHQAFSKPYGLFLQVLTDALLSKEACLERAAALADSPTTGDMLNLLVCYKNPALREADVWDAVDPEIIALFKQAFDAHDVRDRAKISRAVYDILMQDEELTDDMRNCQAACSLGQLDGESNDAVIAGNISDQTLAGEVLSEITAELKQSPEEGGSVPAVREMLMPALRYRTQADSNFRGLGNVLRLLQSTNWTYGTPRKFGSRIIPGRLSRARTDGKVFGIPRPKDSAIETEVILLIDASGSMNNIIEDVVAAAYGSYQSIRQARLRCGVYAHTSDRKQPLLFPVVPLGAVGTEEAFSRVLSIYRQENFDGYAIEATAKKFSRRDGEKILLVFSDGRPNGPNYRGDAADLHTAQVVKHLRKAGYRVISISLTRGVMATNDRIYGKGFNVDASGTRLVPQLKEVIQRIAAGEI